MNQQPSTYATRARDRYGFWLAQGPGDWLHVYIPTGTDPDGSPLTLARPATRAEITLWQQGRLDDLACRLQAELPAIRLPAPQHPTLGTRALARSTWKGFLAKLKALARFGRRKP